MCGIFGWIAGVNTQPGYDTLVELTDSLAHRGPDGGGYELLKLGGGTHSLALGHRRLSIIDLSNSSAQPMWSADGAFCVTFNGEIYNYIELRDELIAMGHRFRTASDTEVLIEAYRTWGEDSVRRFRGMFAFALYDTRNQSVFFARDQFGKKPLYFYEKNGDLVFSSEIWPLTRFPGFDDTFDWDAFDEYFLDRYVAGRRTFFRHILKLQPGCRSRWRAGALSIERYYTPPLASVRSDLTDYEEATKLFAKTLDDAVRLRMRCDAPFGAFISGGMDSSAVVAIMTRHATKAVRTFSIDFSEAQYSEAKESAEIARLFGAHHTSVLITQEALFSHWDEALRRRGAPVCEGSDIPIMILSKRARNDVKMVLTGEGADELFGGYPKYRAELYTETYQRLVPACMHDRLLAPLARLTPHNRRLKVLTKALAVRDTHDRLRIWFGDMSKDERRRLLGRHASDAALDEFPFSIGGVSNFRRAQFFDQTSWLPGNLLERGDRMMMAGSIEGRMPFMDIELAALAARMPDSFHLRDGKTKAVLRSSMKGVLPQWVLSRSAFACRSTNGSAPRSESISRRGLSGRVDLPGWVGPEEVSRLLLEGDVLVLPSLSENLPMSVVEGMAYGLSVVTTPVGAIADIIEHEKTGLLVPPGDSAALAAALGRLLAEPALRAQLGHAAQAFHREHLEIGKFYARLLDIWRSGARAASLRNSY